MFEKLIRIRTQFQYLPETFGLIWEASGRWTLAWALLLVLQGLLPVVFILNGGLCKQPKHRHQNRGVFCLYLNDTMDVFDRPCAARPENLGQFDSLGPSHAGGTGQRSCL